MDFNKFFLAKNENQTDRTDFNLVHNPQFLKPELQKPVFAAVKIGWTVGNYILMKKLYKKNKKLAWIVGTISNVVLSYVVANNIRLINQVKKIENR